jgi:hypothetical protein
MSCAAGRLRRWAMLTAMAAGLARSLGAQGGPPLETDDPGTTRNGHLELNLSLGVERGLDGTELDAPRLDLNYGAGARVQLKLEVPWRVVDQPSQPSRAGLGNLTLGVKWRFAEWNSGRVALSTYPQLTLAGSQGSIARGVADSSTAIFLPVEVAWPLGPLGLGAEIGFSHLSGESELVFGLAAAGGPFPSLELLGECHGSAGTDLSRGGLICGAGGRWELAPLISILSAIEAGVAGASDTRPDLRLYTGAQLRW